MVSKRSGKIVVTGSKGQLGSQLCGMLADRAIGLDLPEFDLTHEKDVLKCLSELRPSVVINTAAFTQVDLAEEKQDLCYAVNARAVETLARVCDELDCQLIQISTDYVFCADDDRQKPYAETDTPHPLGVYAQSKFAGEQAASKCANHLIVRTCGLYVASEGGPVRGKNFVDTMICLGREKDQLKIVDDQICSPSYVPHVAGAILELQRTSQTGLFHVTNSGEATWLEFAREIFQLTGRPVALEPITTQQYGAAAPRPHYSVLDTSKFASACGYELPHWKVGLSEYLKFLG